MKWKVNNKKELLDSSKEFTNKQAFVILKHDSKNLHYHLRMEVDGVLRAWVVPEGPSTDPREKRRAILVDDYPMGYLTNEGVIPEGEYGAGTVMVWDRGYYENIRIENENTVSMSDSFDDGKMMIWLDGQKLRGGYQLIYAPNGEKLDEWGLIKMDDKFADAHGNPVKAQPDSILSGKSMAEIRERPPSANK